MVTIQAEDFWRAESYLSVFVREVQKLRPDIIFEFISICGSHKFDDLPSRALLNMTLELDLQCKKFPLRGGEHFSPVLEYLYLSNELEIDLAENEAKMILPVHLALEKSRKRRGSDYSSESRDNEIAFTCLNEANFSYE